MRGRMCAALALCAAACGDTGSVRLRIELPADPALSPLQPGTVATLTLRAEGEGGAPEVLTYDLGEAAGEAEIGDLDVRDGVRLSLVAATPGGRLIGFGRVAEAISIEAGTDLTVPILFRRPFAYLAGASRLLAMDTTLEPGQQYQSMLNDAQSPSAVEVTRDGAELLVVAGGNLSLLSTSEHRALGASVPVGAVGDLAVSFDSRWGVGVLADGVVIVDLDELRAGTAVPRMVSIPGATSVAVDASAAHVITNGSPTCKAGESTLVTVELAGDTAAPPMPLGAIVSDVAVDRRTGWLIFGEPCRNTIVIMDLADNATSADLMPIPAPTTVATGQGRVWAMGSQGGSLVLASILLVEGTDMSSLTLPAAQQSAVTDDLSEPGQTAEVRMTADAIRATDMAILPDGERVALLSYEQFHADEIDGFIGLAPVIVFPTIDVTTTEYILIDARSGGVIQRLRTTCGLTTSISNWGPELIDPASWRCGENPGQDVSVEAFAPTHLAVLYGDR